MNPIILNALCTDPPLNFAVLFVRKSMAAIKSLERLRFLISSLIVSIASGLL
jgi:hypothetical protein